MSYNGNKTEHNANTNTKTIPCFDLNDPLRYCLEIGEIDEEEYEKWKIVRVSNAITTSKTTTPPIDFGPGYNSDSDSDIDDLALSNTPNPIDVPACNMIYGHGYVPQSSCRRMQTHPDFSWPPYDHCWFPNPDPTPDKQYSGLATSPHHMLTQFVTFESDHNNDYGDNDEGSDSQPPASIARLNRAFQLKIMWERFTQPKEYRFQTLQDFWQTNALPIYEALQELVAMHAKCFDRDSTRRLIPDSPQFHTTPVETLENTFETIGRMSRCIAEDFNDPAVDSYVGDFIHALYTEMRFIELVEARIEILIDIECEEFQKEEMLQNHE
jgi:hypothetical protein